MTTQKHTKVDNIVREVDHMEECLCNIRLEKEQLRRKEDKMITQLIQMSKCQASKKCEYATMVGATHQVLKSTKTDTFQNNLAVGDNVLFLTSGCSEPGIWTIYNLTDRRILCKKRDKMSFRAYKNVKKIR